MGWYEKPYNPGPDYNISRGRYAIKGVNPDGTCVVHQGQDYGTATNPNVPVLAAESGWIHKGDNPGGYGNYIVIEHWAEGEFKGYSLYAHLNEDAWKETQDGEYVSKGDKIGIAGNTGSKDIHLHYEIRPSTDGKYVPWENFGWKSIPAADPRTFPDPYDDSDKAKEVRHAQLFQ